MLILDLMDKVNSEPMPTLPTAGRRNLQSLPTGRQVYSEWLTFLLMTF